METRGNLRTIQEALRSADNDLRLMKSMSAAKRSADKTRTGLQGIGKSNALERIRERKQKLETDLEKSRALKEISEENSKNSLEDATRKALEGGKGETKLAEIKARLQAPE